MQTYYGTKIIQAEAMSRGAYNTYRGWQIPADENPNDEGYLVKYSDGYISWSPAKQFNEAYRPIEVEGLEAHQVRVVIEHSELAGRLIALQAFLNTELFAGLDALERNRLEKQAQLMYELRVVLADRISSFRR